MTLKIALAALVLSLSTTAYGQGGPSPAARDEDRKPLVDEDRKPLVVVGCLQPGAQPNQFVLMATADPLAKGVAVATSGAIPNITYQLSGGNNLAAHVGHRVELTGRSTGRA